MENVLIHLFILGSWHRSYYIMRPILVYKKIKKELKKKKEGNKMGKETDRQTYYPIVEFVFMLVWSQNFGFTLGKLSTIIGLRASWENPQFCSQLRLKKKKNEFRQSWRLWIISFCHVNCTAINISVFNKRHIKKLFLKNLKMLLSHPSMHIDYSKWIF